MQICQNQCIFHAPPAHLLPQYCTLLGKTRPRHRPHSGTAGTASSHRLPAPPGTTRALAPASHLQTAKRRAHQTVDAASTPKGE